MALTSASIWAQATNASSAAPPQDLSGCPSEVILAKFKEIGKTGKMPPDLGRWLGDPKAQYIEPYKAFDNVYYVGVCWVSAWIVKTSAGIVLIDTLTSDNSLLRAVGRLLHVDDPDRLTTYKRLVNLYTPPEIENLPVKDKRYLRMLIASLVDQVVDKTATLDECLLLLWQHPKF